MVGWAVNPPLLGAGQPPAMGGGGGGGGRFGSLGQGGFDLYHSYCTVRVDGNAQSKRLGMADTLHPRAAGLQLRH